MRFGNGAALGVRELGSSLGWEVIYDTAKCPRDSGRAHILDKGQDNSHVLAFRMPLPAKWLARTFDRSGKGERSV